ncbi:ATP-dependent helicase [Paenibacillus caseinilyticus]|uniref:DNA 3'-5' helicase n=1 Tax=Paenibacillus mucilaginosus K02 TaxID=997761 RepID=I0BMT6_9BACL|nr:ATP-dependent helicase [Paenibacillus mucilaginosus]AFH63683.1 helicase UvrD [Paenibacillus mucilaginosus K02]
MHQRKDFFASKKEELGVSLNEVQKQAIRETEGPLLLLASPGSGKTTTIIMRIGYLIERMGVEPSRIKAVTFSRASAADMKERFARFFPGLEPVKFSTIHSLAFQVLREHFYKTRTPYHLIEGQVELEEETEGDGAQPADHPPLHKKFILRHLFKTIAGENITDEQMEELTTYISLVKNKMIPPERWDSVKTDVPQAHRVLIAYEEYKRAGSGKGLLVDFDDMLTIGNEILERDRELLRRYQRRYDYVLTDESQDTSLVQHAIIEKLVREHGNLCVVADDDQSIYSWRGADPSYLLNFKDAYPAALTLFMEQNYRSSRDIVDVANRFIKRNKNRYEKNMFTRNPRSAPAQIRSFADYKSQAKYLVEEIRGIAELGEVAVLYRNNSSSIALINEFDRAGIPFFMKDTDNRFFSHWVVEDVLNFMRMSFTDKRADLLETIHTKCAGYITKGQMTQLLGIGNQESVFDNLLKHVPLKEYQVKQIELLRDNFRRMHGMAPKDAIRHIRGKLGYEKALDRLCERLGFRKEHLLGILNTLEEIADTLATMEEFAARLKHLEGVLKSSKHKKGQNVVTFSTLHSAKGLEFERVYMIDLIDGIIPSSDDKQGATAEEAALSMEEAVRLFYVGMTRAKRHLELLTYKMRDGEKVQESPFVTDVRQLLNPGKPAVRPEPGRPAAAVTSGRGPSAAQAGAGRAAGSGKSASPARKKNPNAVRQAADLAAGRDVLHPVFGSGTIVKLAGERIHIRFGTTDKVLSVATCLEMGLLELEKS